LWALFGFDGIFDVEFKSPSGDIYSKSIEGIDIVQYDSIRKQRKPRKPNYSFYKTSHGDIGVIDFRRMSNNGRFRKFTDSVFTVMENDNMSALIIDVRKNGGGNSQLVDVLFSHFNTKPYTQAERMDLKVSGQSRKAFRKRHFKWYVYPLYPVTLFYKQSRQLLFGRKGRIVTLTNEPETHRISKPFFKGPVYLLTSPNTFSSANILADVFKCYEMGIIIGEETGGLTIAFGDLIFYTLENTGLHGNCSFKQFFHPCAKPDNHGVIPDIEVIQNLKDTEKGIDTVLEFTIDHILQN
jgi:C-terminal processing protease CtpA/Prc